jgi:hypothetical protein
VAYTKLVSQERQRLLLAATTTFDGIANRINEEMRIISFDVCRGKRGKVKGCRRPQFALQVSEVAFDLFFNSPRGYRAQYHKSPEHGERENAKLISLMLHKLISYAGDKTPKHPMSAELLEVSLNAKSAKIWINEQGVRSQQGDDIANKRIYLDVEPWVSTARAFFRAPSNYPDNNKEIKAVDGVKAPTGTTLEVKGAFVDDNGNEQIAEGKEDRSRQIHLYGFT